MTDRILLAGLIAGSVLVGYPQGTVLAAPASQEAACLPAASPAPTGDVPTHVIVADTPYYRTGPQQARPPDGTFRAGTQVWLIQEAGSYCRVRSPDGVEAYVAVTSLKPIADKPANRPQKEAGDSAATPAITTSPAAKLKRLRWQLGKVCRYCKVRR